MTLSRFILEEFKGERQELSFVMNAISVACKIIAQAVQQAGVKQCDSFTGITSVFERFYVDFEVAQSFCTYS